MKKPIAILTEIIKQNNIELSFNIIEIGAVQLTDAQEPFYELLNYFPSSQIIGFELEEAVCAKMNANANTNANANAIMLLLMLMLDASANA